MDTQADDRVWTEFVEWCRRRRLRPLPAHAWTISAYVRWCEARHGYAGAALRVKAISRRHLLAGRPGADRDPLVQRTLRLVERREETRGQRAALFPDPASDPTIKRNATRPKTPESLSSTESAKPSKSVRRRTKPTLAAVPKLVRRRPQES